MMTRFQICGSEVERTYDLRGVLRVDEDVFETEIMAVKSKLFGAIIKCRLDKSVHQSHPSAHLLLDPVLPLRRVRQKESAPLHPPVISIHRIPGSLPLVFTLFKIPFVTVVTLITWNSGQSMMSR